MKILKGLGILVLILVVIWLVMCIIAPAKMEVSRSITIDRSAAVIFPEVNDIRNRMNWSPWELADTTMKVTYGEITEGVGAVSSWDSENSGTGRQEILESQLNSYIKTQLEFDDRPGINYSEWMFEDMGGSTKVNWTFDGSESSFPTRFFNLLFKGMVVDQYEKGLQNLKEFAEAKPHIVVKDIGSEVFRSELTVTQYIITTRDTTTPDGLSDVYEASYAAISAFMLEKGLEREAAPIGIYHHYSDTMVIVEPGIPVNEPLEVPEGMFLTEIAPTAVASATHLGPWENIGSTHESIILWIDANGAEITGSPWHVYFNNLDEVKDPSQLYTQVHYPIK